MRSFFLVAGLTSSLAHVANAQLNITAQTTFDQLAAAIVNLGYPNITQAPVTTGLKRSGFCSTACSLLQFALGSKVALQGSNQYSLEQQGYWSVQQESVSPQCRVQPTNPLDISATLLIAEFTSCQFAVKGGGHAAFEGASNIEGGITIDLGKLKTIEVSTDKTYAKVGAGNTWYEVYSTLANQGLAAVGGRVAAIGGGLILGGGISFHSGLHGWACDNVKNYELVTASGLILQVNYQSYPDLYWALRGGGNNFGIVTRFDLDIFPQGNMWGGSVTYLSNDAMPAQQFSALMNITNSGDPKAAVWVAATYYSGLWLFSNELTYTDPVENPPIFDEFLSIQPQITNTVAITSLSNLTIATNATNPGGYREHYATASYKASEEMLEAIYQVFQNNTLPIADAANITPAVTIQTITVNVLEQMEKNGGNALGLTPEEGPYIIINLSTSWSDEGDDARIIAASSAIVSQTTAIAKELGLECDYLYQNYAAEGQAIFQSYGQNNHARLKAISKKYDPLQVFENLQPGYFKLAN